MVETSPTKDSSVKTQHYKGCDVMVMTIVGCNPL